MTQSLHDELTRLTCELIAIPSIDERPDQLQAVIDYAEAYARAVPGVYIHRLEWDGKPSLVVTLRDTRAPAIMYNAHLDVVPGRPEQFTPEIRAGRIYGRGSQDMKGSAAVLLRLLHDLAALPEPPDVGFQFVSDEEIGGEQGTGKLAEHGWLAGFFLAAEPTDLQICYQQKGVLWVEVAFTGKPAHGSRPWDGVNPFVVLQSGLAAMEARYPTPDEAAWLTTAVPTVINGGEAKNRLPANMLLTLDVRHIPDETPAQVMAALNECFKGAEVRLVRSGPPLDTNPHGNQIGRLAACTAEVTGWKPPLYREHFASDARFYSDIGVPAVCFGPVGAGLHSDEEWVEINSLATLYQALYRFSLQERA